MIKTEMIQWNIEGRRRTIRRRGHDLLFSLSADLDRHRSPAILKTFFDGLFVHVVVWFDLPSRTTP